MKVAIISDIHGNYPALINVIEDAERNQVDKFLFLGDYIFELPHSNEVTRLLMQMKNSYIISGNKEVFLRDLAIDNQENWTDNQMAVVYQTYKEMPLNIFRYLVSLNENYRIELDNDLSLYATHYFEGLKPSPKYSCTSSAFRKNMLERPFTHEEYLKQFSELINGDEYKSCIDNIDANVIAFGHIHLQGYGYCGDKLIINPGACGQPLDFDNRASYSILETYDNGSLNVIEKRVSYDIESAICQAKKSIMYDKGLIWNELVFLALKTGIDHFCIMFEIAEQIAVSKGENGTYYTNETWNEAYEIFLKRL